MATSKTGSFWLTESIDLTATDTYFQGTIDLGAYVDVGDQQALAIEEVDFIVQAHVPSTNSYTNSLSGALVGNTGIGTQLMDLNPNTEMVRADDNSLIASGVMYYNDTDFISSMGPDLYPDSFGKLDESRMVVNDSLYLVSAFHTASLAADRALTVTARIKCRIVKLSTKDWMAIAIQSTAADN
tara:strand:+ start:160 stop:711 length:552 start_codon:yes stop_codon:yes gene_type:complete